MNASQIKTKNNNSKVIVRKSPISGKGLFATQNIKKGEVIYKVEGHTHEFHPDDDTWSIPHAVSYSKNKWINPHPTNPLRYTNHSCKPNSVLTHGLKVVALQDIKSREEIVFDYSLSEEDPETIMGKCRCNNKECRREITPIHQVPETIVSKNKKHIQKWILDSYYEKKK